MKFIDFHTIAIQNFLSVGEEPVIVNFTTGLHIITGVNRDKQDRRNGVGKSTIADAIHFAIFGNTIRDLKKENIVNHLVGSGTVVQLDFDIIDNDIITSYKVVRSLEPSRCKLYINDKDETRDSISNTTEYICSILNTTQDIFQNCVVMTVNHTIPFMAKKKVEKRKFIEGIFNLEVFSNMLSQLRVEYNDVKRDIDVEQAKYLEAEKSLQQYEEDKEDYIKSKKKALQKLTERKNNNEKQLNDLTDKTFDTDGQEIFKIQESIEAIDNNLQTCEDKLTDINTKITELTTTGKHKKDTLSKIGTKSDKCPVCLRTVSLNDKEHIETEKSKLRDDIRICAADIVEKRQALKIVVDLKDGLKRRSTDQTNLLTEHNLKISESKLNQKNVEQFKKWNLEIENDIENLNKQNNQYDDSIKKQQQRLQDIQTKITNIQHKLSVLDVVKFVVSEEGVKSYIVKKILQIFNSKLAFYLSKMDANCLCIFNEYFEEEIVDEKGKMCSYYNFSGAERKNIDLACLFAFMDIRRLQGSVAYNFSMYDELLDSSLDEKGVELVLQLLKDRVDNLNECIMIISHRKESVKIGSHHKNPGEVIYLEKKNGITKRVEFKEEES
tara:strand:+ start:6580 stop:8406 length:1827 start_codon:yes stop_codon:yes gene_type:complete